MFKRYRAHGTVFKRGHVRYLSLVLLLSVSTLVFADRVLAATTVVEFNIPAQAVPAALDEFARQSNSQLLFISDGFEDVQANAVVGAFPRQEALDRLLMGTGLQARLSAVSVIGVTLAAADEVSSAVLPPGKTTLALADGSDDRVIAEVVDEGRPPTISQENVPGANNEKTPGVAVGERSTRGWLPLPTEQKWQEWLLLSMASDLTVWLVIVLSFIMRAAFCLWSYWNKQARLERLLAYRIAKEREFLKKIVTAVVDLPNQSGIPNAVARIRRAQDALANGNFSLAADIYVEAAEQRVLVGNKAHSDAADLFECADALASANDPEKAN